jgi:hypothetical protein
MLRLETDGCRLYSTPDRIVVAALEHVLDIPRNPLEGGPGLRIELLGRRQLAVDLIEMLSQGLARHVISSMAAPAAASRRRSCIRVSYRIMAMQSRGGNGRARARPQGRAVWIAIGFLLAFAATIATVVLTGLAVREPVSSFGARDGTSDPAGADDGATIDRPPAPGRQPTSVDQ